MTHRPWKLLSWQPPAAGRSPGSQTPAAKGSSHAGRLGAMGTPVPRARQADTRGQEGSELPPSAGGGCPNPNLSREQHGSVRVPDSQGMAREVSAEVTGWDFSKRVVSPFSPPSSFFQSGVWT